MKKLRLIIAKSVVDDTVRSLHELGVVEITRTEYKDLDSGRPLSSFDEVSSLLVRLRAINSLMEGYVDKSSASSARIQGDLIDPQIALTQGRLFDLDQKVKVLVDQNAKISDQLKDLESKLSLVKKLLVFETLDFSKLSTRSLNYRVGEIPLANIIKMTNKLGAIGEEISVVSKSGSKVVVVLFDRRFEVAVDSVLNELDFTPLQVPNSITVPVQTAVRLLAEIEKINTQLKQIRAELTELSKNNLKYVKILIRSLEVVAERAIVASHFSSSRYFYLVEGWLAVDNFDQLKSTLARYGDSVALQEVDFGHDRPVKPPIVFDNPKPATSFEFITTNYSLPNYYEIDPTLAYSIGLPILYGMIVGDVLYGVLSILISLYILKKFKNSDIMQSIGKIWLISSIPTIIFGILFDEWGGVSHFSKDPHKIGLAQYVGEWTGVQLLDEPLYTGFHRVEGVPNLLLICIFVAFIHLAFGFILGAVNEWNHNRKHAMAKLSWLGLEIGVLLIFLAQLQPAYPAQLKFFDPTAFTTIGTIIAGLCVLAIGFTEGLMGIIELPGFAGNILSYTRIAVVGVVGVILAEIINEYLKPSPSQGLLLLVTVPVFLLLHTANCAIAMFEAVVQGGRLNIVEFRSKFFHGGGVLFTPFVMKKSKG